MRVALINNGHKDTGFGKYAFELYDELGKSDIEIDHYLFNRKNRSLDKVSRKGVESIHKERKNPIIDNAFLMKLDRLPNLFLDFRLGKFVPRGYDLYHITNQNICNIDYYKNISKRIITVHDLIFYVCPTNLVKKSLSQWIYKGLANSDFIISVSEATKNDLIKYFNISERKIKVVYSGVNDCFRPLRPLELNCVYYKYGLERNCRYILHVGNPEPRKNVITLIKSFQKLITDFNVKDVRLLKINKLSKDNEKAIVELGLQKYIKVINDVSEEDLIILYNIASVFIFPSFYEGFGFPPLEAMACGTPVIASNISSIPEIVGNAGILLCANDEDGFARAMYEVLANENLRQDMIAKGLERAKRFSWVKCAKKTLEVYREIAGGLN